MNIALIGYGKMGKAIEEIAISRGHSVVVKFNSQNPLESSQLRTTDVAIEFSQPDLALKHIKLCADGQIPIVVGTTAWEEHLPEIINHIDKREASLIYSSNFSIGVNLFFEMNKHLARLMNDKTDYVASITEIHHKQKIDAPSGTAVTLAKDLISNHPAYSSWKLTGQSENMDKTDLPISAIREENVPGTHLISYTSEIDTLTIEHQAHNRKGFALGAVIAAEFIHKKQGVYTMSDILKF
ncbi:MAG: 4-hydroxy-tetrahydrodipicolinate reductase [Crocinitomicaceae bacterium]|nr:4-hydroxy-tetrahydrodipicolinate reductase [Crocinitomicaceae bacterium]